MTPSCPRPSWADTFHDTFGDVLHFTTVLEDRLGTSDSMIVSVVARNVDQPEAMITTAHDSITLDLDQLRALREATAEAVILLARALDEHVRTGGAR